MIELLTRPRPAPGGPVTAAHVPDADPAPLRLVALGLTAGLAVEVGARGGPSNLVVAVGIAIALTTLATDRRIRRAAPRRLVLAALLPTIFLAVRASPWLAAANLAVVVLLVTAAVLHARSASLVDTTPPPPRETPPPGARPWAPRDPAARRDRAVHPGPDAQSRGQGRAGEPRGPAAVAGGGGAARRRRPGLRPPAAPRPRRRARAPPRGPHRARRRRRRRRGGRSRRRRRRRCTPEGELRGARGHHHARPRRRRDRAVLPLTAAGHDRCRPPGRGRVAPNLGIGGGRDWVVAGAVTAALVLVVVADVAEPEGFVVRHNLARARAGAELDVAYLAGLSDDAVPALIEAAGDGSAGGRGLSLDDAIVCRRQDPRGTAAWNLARRRAADALAEACGS